MAAPLAPHAGEPSNRAVSVQSQLARGPTTCTRSTGQAGMPGTWSTRSDT